jgi:hypothetical protein
METVTLYTMYRGHIMFFTLIAITTLVTYIYIHLCMYDVSLDNWIQKYHKYSSALSDQNVLQYMCVRDKCYCFWLSFYDFFSIRFCNSSDSVVFFVFLLDFVIVPAVWYFLFFILFLSVHYNDMWVSELVIVV